MDKVTAAVTSSGQTGSTPAGRWSESGMELGHHLPAHHRGMAVVELNLLIDFWSRKVVLWVVAGREGPSMASDLFSRVFLRERISKGRK